MPKGKIKFPTYHNPLDAACREIESEARIPRYGYDLDFEIEQAMEWRPLKWLESYYPELEFGLSPTRTKADYCKRFGSKKYIWANWRKK